MVGISAWFRYIASKFEYSVSLTCKGQIADAKVLDSIWRNLLQGRLTYLHWNKGEEMAPMIGTQGGTLLVRKIPAADPTRSPVTNYVFYLGRFQAELKIHWSQIFGEHHRRVHVGDVVVLKDPEKSDSYLVRRLAAIEGYEMVSTHKTDEPFDLEKDQCWVLADNKDLKPKDAYDSRTFGPVTMTDIVGRVIYCLRNAVDHGPVNNSNASTTKDSPVLEVELDVDEMAKNLQA